PHFSTARREDRAMALPTKSSASLSAAVHAPAGSARRGWLWNGTAAPTAAGAPAPEPRPEPAPLSPDEAAEEVLELRRQLAAVESDWRLDRAAAFSQSAKCEARVTALEALVAARDVSDGAAALPQARDAALRRPSEDAARLQSLQAKLADSQDELRCERSAAATADAAFWASKALHAGAADAASQALADGQAATRVAAATDALRCAVARQAEADSALAAREGHRRRAVEVLAALRERDDAHDAASAELQTRHASTLAAAREAAHKDARELEAMHAAAAQLAARRFDADRNARAAAHDRMLSTMQTAAVGRPVASRAPSSPSPGRRPLDGAPPGDAAQRAAGDVASLWATRDADDFVAALEQQARQLAESHHEAESRPPQPATRHTSRRLADAAALRDELAGARAAHEAALEAHGAVLAAAISVDADHAARLELEAARGRKFQRQYNELKFQRRNSEGSPAAAASDRERRALDHNARLLDLASADEQKIERLRAAVAAVARRLAADGSAAAAVNALCALAETPSDDDDGATTGETTVTDTSPAV
ncbi:hypothetical protein M885DRAFT_530848, partial [Pelagophyceae sp. CCMP2097]